MYISTVIISPIYIAIEVEVAERICGYLEYLHRVQALCSVR